MARETLVNSRLVDENAFLKNVMRMDESTVYCIERTVQYGTVRYGTVLGPVVQRWVSANPGLKFNPLF
jgi:hypothetical protein